MSESNLARSLFPTGDGQLIRKKYAQGTQQDLDSQLQPMQTPDLASQPADQGEIDLDNFEVFADDDHPEIFADEGNCWDMDTEAALDELEQELAEMRSQHQTKCDQVTQLESALESVKLSQAQQEQQNAALAAQLAQAEATARSLQQVLDQHLSHNSELETYQQKLIENLDTAEVKLMENNKSLHKVQAKLFEAIAQKDDLETQVVKHLANQAMLQQSLQNLDHDYANAQDRIQELEFQLIELQEHFLKQAGQASEYEAAVQHWKDQTMHHQRHAVQLSGALERLLQEKESQKATLEVQQTEISQDTEAPEIVPVVASHSKSSFEPAIIVSKSHSRVDLPSFLVRQR